MSYRPYSAIVAEAQSSNSKVTAQIINDSGSTIPELTPVTIDVNGKIKAMDVSVDAEALKTAGLLETQTLDSAVGNVILIGKIENVTTSFDFGDYLYVSKTGGLTNQLPSVGVDGFVDGDFVIKMGLVTRNRTIPANKDYLIRIEIVGQL